MDMTRDEIRSPSTTFDQKLRNLVHDLFDADEKSLLKFKSDLLMSPQKMARDILPHFHPYFETLKPMVLQWWYTLRLAYRFRAFEYDHIHTHIIDILQEAISRSACESDSEATRVEIQRRITERKLERERLELAHNYKAHEPELNLGISPNRDPLPSIPHSWAQKSPNPATKKRRTLASSLGVYAR